jgi:hypothetical protein
MKSILKRISQMIGVFAFIGALFALPASASASVIHIGALEDGLQTLVPAGTFGPETGYLCPLDAPYGCCFETSLYSINGKERIGTVLFMPELITTVAGGYDVMGTRWVVFDDENVVECRHVNFSMQITGEQPTQPGANQVVTIHFDDPNTIGLAGAVDGGTGHSTMAGKLEIFEEGGILREVRAVVHCVCAIEVKIN